MSADFVIIGAGIVGLTVAFSLLKRYPASRIIILEKESSIGLHASGRNSGVIHSGVYYPKGSLKAKLCVDGSHKMIDYCKSNDLAINQCGKLILPIRETDGEVLKNLANRANQNGISAEFLDEKQTFELEPLVKSATGKALFIPITSVTDSKVILNHLSDNLQSKGVKIFLDSICYDVDIKRKRVSTPRGEYHYGHLVNCAGIYADELAKQCDLVNRYTVIPFKGLYYKLLPRFNDQINHLIYPVPDMNMPFLGVHLTKSIYGDIYVGPSAIPAFGKEHYKGLEGVSIRDAGSMLYHVFNQYVRNHNGFRYYTHNEVTRVFKSQFVKAAQKLIPSIKKEDLVNCPKVGIRAQLVDKLKNELVMDFLIEKTANETHVLNAVSPAFTSSFSCGEFIVQNLENSCVMQTL